MFMHVIEAKYIDDYRVWLLFNDGAKGEVDLSPELLSRSHSLEGVLTDETIAFVPRQLLF